MKFKEGTTDEQIDRLLEEVLNLTEAVDGVEDYVAGPNNSSEGLAKGFTHGFIMTFQDAAARDACLAHPEHERVQALLREHLADTLVFDFEI